MALLKDVTQETGVIAKYHNARIANLDWRHGKRVCVVNVYSYLDKASRDDGRNHITFETFNFGDNEDFRGPFPFEVDGNVSEQVYSVLKALPEFAGAVDI